MEIIFEAIARAHGQLARKRVMADIRVLARDTQDMIKTTVGQLLDPLRSGALLPARIRAVNKHLYESLGTAIGLGMLVALIISRTRSQDSCERTRPAPQSDKSR